MKFVFIGLSITSSWGNGHATTYRALLRELAALGHEILFLEHDVPYYASNRDMPEPAFCTTRFYSSVDELKSNYEREISEADMVCVGSYVIQGVEVGRWVINTAGGLTAFYDIDTPVTLAKLERQEFDYLEPDLIGKYDVYFSFTGGPTLKLLEQKYGSAAARDLYCSVDPELYYPERLPNLWDLGYLGTYSIDRQPGLEKLLCQTAREMPFGRFVVAGPQYPKHILWPTNVQRINHLPPSGHKKFYNSQRFTLNITRADMIKAGYSPSVRLFEAAACGVPIISDYWKGIETIFEPGKEILISKSAEETLAYLNEITEEERTMIGENARQKTLMYHTARSRAQQLEQYTMELLKDRAGV
jgi:spore maturation protein CgeB